MQLIKRNNIYNRLKRKFLSHTYLARIVTLLLIVIALGSFYLGAKKLASAGSLSSLAVIAPLRQTSNRTNILILGIRGESVDAPNLTDTIILASVSHLTGDTALISIPRDLWLPSLGVKINSVYNSGLEKSGPQSGLTLAKSAITEVAGQPVHYGVVINFSIFQQFIDALGGIDIDVPHTFDDYRYPIPGKEDDLCSGDPLTLCRYEHIHFDAGLQHMNGETALKFVRSRHSEDPVEGNDFARSKRQELVIQAVKNQLVSKGNIGNLQLYRKLYDLYLSSVVTDFSSQDYLALAQLAQKAYSQPLRSTSITEPDQLINPPLTSTYGFQWVLVPKDNNSQLIKDFVANHFHVATSSSLQQ